VEVSQPNRAILRTRKFWRIRPRLFQHHELCLAEIKDLQPAKILPKLILHALLSLLLKINHKDSVLFDRRYQYLMLAHRYDSSPLVDVVTVDEMALGIKVQV
jgi:hypothetical protein